MTHAAQSSTTTRPAAIKNLSVGERVRITQQTPRQQNAFAITVEGVIQRIGQQKTGSWFAHSKDDKLWLDRVELKKADGELVVVNLDRYSVVEYVN